MSEWGSLFTVDKVESGLVSGAVDGRMREWLGV